MPTHGKQKIACVSPPTGALQRGHGMSGSYNATRLSLLLLVVLPDLRLADRLEQPLDNVLVADPLGLGLKVRADAMPQHRDGNLFDIVDRDAVAAVHRRHRLCPLDQVDAGTG